MSKEIENILGNINFEVETEQEWLEPLGLDRNTWKQILNYITNLQEENKQLKEDKKEAVKYINRTQMPEGYKKVLLEILGDKE